MRKIGLLINGYGRIGRILHRIILRAGERRLQVRAINSRAGAASHAHLLKYDSTYGRLKEKIDYGKTYLKINGQKIKVFVDKDPGEIDFKKEGIEVVAECTGKFRDRESCQKQLQAGAKKVVISATGKQEDIMIVMGVNHQQYRPQKDHIVANASCTTNALALVVKVLQDNFKISAGQMTTIHALTLSQNMLDGSHPSDLRVARAAISSFMPYKTGASQAIGKIFPELEGKLDGVSVRILLATVSLVDLVVLLKKNTSAEEINQLFLEKSKTSLKGFLGITMAPLVSIDFKGDSRTTIIDGLSTKVINKRLVKIFSWYDNEWGYCCRLYDLLKLVSKRLPN